MPDDTKQLMDWTQQPGERPQDYAKFHIYLMLGPNRSALHAYHLDLERQGKSNRPKSIAENWRGIVARWDWKGRAERYDASQRGTEQAAIEEARREFLKMELQVGMKGLKKADKMLDFPLANSHATDAEGRNITIEAPDWSFTTAMSIAASGSGLCRKSLQLEHADTTVRVEGALQELPKHLADVAWLKEIEDDNVGDKTTNGNGK